MQTPSQDQYIPVRVQLDTGATCSMMSLHDYKRITGKSPPATNAKLKLCDGTLIEPMGEDILHCHKAGTSKEVDFKVLRTAPTALLSGRAAEALGLFQVNPEHLVHTVTGGSTLKEEAVLNTDVFQGLGRLPDLYHIDITPASSQYRTPDVVFLCHYKWSSDKGYKTWSSRASSRR